MQWLKTNAVNVLLIAAAACAAVCVAQYIQMGEYNNYDANNWKIVLGWGLASAGLVAVSLALSLPMSPLHWLTDPHLPESALSVVSPTNRLSSTGPVQQVAALRQRADSAHKNGDELNAQAADLVAKMEAELVAAKKLLGGGK